MKWMKIMAKVLLVLVMILILIGSALFIYARFFYEKDDTVELCYMSEMSVEPADFHVDFEELHQIVLDKYSLYESKKLNMDSLFQEFSSRIKDDVKSKTDYGRLLLEYFAALQGGHSFVYFQNYSVNCFPTFIQDSLFVDNPSKYLRHYGFDDKDQIIAIDGIPVKEWLDENEKYIPASTEPNRRLCTARRAFSSYTDSVRNYSLVRNEDTVHVALPLRSNGYFLAKYENTVDWEILHDSIGYLAIQTMMGNVVDDFVKAYEHVKMLPYLIVDVRSNSGGNSLNSMKICQYLIKNKQPHCVDQDRIMEPASDRYLGKIYLLTSNLTFSAAESFVLDIRESDNATLVGEPTGGDTGNNPRNFYTERGTLFRIPIRKPKLSPKGFPMEGVGIPPHYQVSQTVTDFLNNRDTQLDYVLELISSQK